MMSFLLLPIRFFTRSFFRNSHLYCVGEYEKTGNIEYRKLKTSEMLYYPRLWINKGPYCIVNSQIDLGQFRKTIVFPLKSKFSTFVQYEAFRGVL